MPNRKPAILVLFCGGTIAMRQDSKTSALQPGLDVEELMAYAPFLKEEFDIHVKTITNIDSTNIQPTHWIQIADAIYKKYSEFDGFVVVHGTDTMSYTAAALSFALQNLGKPIVLTGAQVPPHILGTDAISNLVNACQAATMDFAEVAIVFGTKILRGNRSMKVSESERNAFISPVFPELGSIRLQPEITNPETHRRHGGSLELKNAFSGNIAVLKIVPGMQPSIIEAITKTDIDGLILESFGPGNIPNQENSLLPAITAATKKGIPVLVSTQCIYGTTRMYLYEVGQQAMELGVIPTSDMTPEATYVKLKWALAQSKDTQSIKEIFEKDIAGEVAVG
jgi:L-asparaginase